MLLTLLYPFSSKTPQRSLILIAGVLSQLPIGQENTGKKPIVILNGAMQQRVTTEGVALVSVQGVIRGLLSTESLIS